MWYFIISLCSVACCFFLTCLFGIPQEVLEADGESHDPAFRENQLTGKNAGEMPDEITGEAVSDMVSPADGHILPLDQVKDEVFAGRVLGDGFAVELTGGRILWHGPCSGNPHGEWNGNPDSHWYQYSGTGRKGIPPSCFPGTEGTQGRLSGGRGFGGSEDVWKRSDYHGYFYHRRKRSRKKRGGRDGRGWI